MSMLCVHKYIYVCVCVCVCERERERERERDHCERELISEAVINLLKLTSALLQITAIQNESPMISL